eukprot:SAG25_NODE_10417_length_335_cov_1.088983_1_plen_77_part_10
MTLLPHAYLGTVDSCHGHGSRGVKNYDGRRVVLRKVAVAWHLHGTFKNIRCPEVARRSAVMHVRLCVAAIVNECVGS